MQMVQENRLPHALLLSAPVGSGELSLARALAQYVHCTGRQPDDADSCGRCPSCLQHQSFNHPDLHFVFPVNKRGSSKATIADDWMDEWREYLTDHPWADFKEWQVALGDANKQPKIYVHEAEQLRRVMSLSARSSDVNIVLLWLPERLEPEAANKLLKLVEEPEEGSMFIMVTNAPGEVLPTIYSRCQRLELRRLPDATVAEIIGGDMASAHLAEGNVIAAFAARDASAQTAAQLDLFINLMRMAYARRVADMKKWSEKVAELGRDGICRFMEYCQRMIRENFIMNLHVSELNYMNGAEEAFSSKFSPFVNEKNVEQIIAEMDAVITDVRGNGNAKIVLFDFAVKMIMLLKQK